MIDPKLRVIKRNQIGHALHRQGAIEPFARGGMVSEIGDAAVVPIFLQVNCVNHSAKTHPRL